MFGCFHLNTILYFNKYQFLDLEQPQNSVTDPDDGFDTNSMSTIDETNNSSTNSIITEINNVSIADGDFSEESISNLINDDLFETQTIRGSTLDVHCSDEYSSQMEMIVRKFENYEFVR